MKRRADSDIIKKGPVQKPKLHRQKSFLIQDRGIKGELKVTDVILNADPLFGSSTFTTPALINGIAIGGDYNNRVGRKVVWTKILLRWNITSTQGTGGANYRIIAVYDKQTNGVTPAVTDILSADSFSSFNNLNNRDRFITLFDEITPSVGQNGDASIAGLISRKISLETIFNSDTTAAVSAINTGAIWFMAAQSGGIGVTSADFHARARLRFTDA